MYQVIYKHVNDEDESVLLEGSEAECKAHIALLKANAEKYFTTWKWMHNGFCVHRTYYVELREANEAAQAAQEDHPMNESNWKTRALQAEEENATLRTQAKAAAEQYEQALDLLAEQGRRIKQLEAAAATEKSRANHWQRLHGRVIEKKNAKIDELAELIKAIGRLSRIGTPDQMKAAISKAEHAAVRPHVTQAYQELREALD